MVHTREAADDTIELLDAHGEGVPVIIHCFSLSDRVQECVERRWYCSFAGNVTYPKNAHMREAAAAVSLDRVLVETDSPFLAPQKLRGSDNAPENVVITLAELASVRNEPLGLLADATVSNAEAAFPGL